MRRASPITAAARHPGDDRDAAHHADGEGACRPRAIGADGRARRRDASTTPMRMRASMEARARPDLRPSVRRSARSSPGRAPSRSKCSRTCPSSTCWSLPIGGGGLISGMRTAARGIKPDIGLIGVEAELYPVDVQPPERHRSAVRRRHAGRGHRGQAAGRVHVARSRGAARRHRAGHRARSGKGGGAAAADREDRGRRRGRGRTGGGARASASCFAGRNVGIVLCGGNIDTRLLANVLLRDLARSGRLARLRITLQDRPGALFKVARVFDAAAGQHHRNLAPARLHRRCPPRA